MANPQDTMKNRPNTGTGQSATTSGVMGSITDKAGDIAERARGVASDVADKARDTASGMADRARGVASDVADKARDVASGVGDRVTGAPSSVGGGMKTLADSIRQHAPDSGMLHEAGSAVADTLESSGRYLQEEGWSGIGDDVTNMIRRNPIPALLVGVAVGFLLARATSDRS